MTHDAEDTSCVVISCICFPKVIRKQRDTVVKKVLSCLEDVEPFSREWGLLVAPQFVPDQWKSTWTSTRG